MAAVIVWLYLVSNIASATAYEKKDNIGKLHKNTEYLQLLFFNIIMAENPTLFIYW